MITSMRDAMRFAVVAGAWLAAAGTAAAEPRRFELGGFLGLDVFGDDIELGNSWAMEQKPGTSLLFGVRLAYFVLPDVTNNRDAHPHLDLGLEAEAKFAAAFTGGVTAGEGRESYFAPVVGWRGHLIARLAGLTPHLAPHLVVGGGGETVTSESPFMATDTDGVFYYGLGAVWTASSRWAVRLDGRHGLTAGRSASVTSTFELQLGVSARLGGSGPSEPPTPADTDGDGLADDVDRCPAEPETDNGFEDTDGCPDDPDRDGDGLRDDVDTCPADAENKNGIDDDDGCPDADGDKDGILGSRDTCPDQPEDMDGFQDDDGCPDPDNDADGIPDGVDRCATQAEVWNGIVDDDGCPDELPAKVRAFEGTLRGINFANGKARILASSKKRLAETVAVLREFPGIRIQIEGHTDGRGARDKNLDLSRRRAEAVKWHLVDQGIAADRLETAGAGPDRPVANDRTAGGRAKNRRIEIHVLPVPQPSAPATQPSAPATQPTAPATQPSDG
jgi:outer membrane protein OmpA-like peptidoglycan-associated protein